MFRTTEVLPPKRLIIGGYSPATLDSARNMAERVGYLGKTARLGYYEVLNHFPSEYTVSQLRKDYDNGYDCNN